jgi:cell division GTPase FtsZ
VARVAKQSGALVVGIVTLPFSFEGRKRSQAALAGLAALREEVDTLITIPNDRLVKPSQPELTLNTAFKIADEILRQTVGGLAELVTTPGLINLDFADLRSVMSGAGTALMAIGAADGPDRARKAARAALASPLLGLEVTGARGVVCNVTGGEDLTLLEVQTVAEVISAAAHPDATLIFGAVTDEAHAGSLQVTVVASGFADNNAQLGLPPIRGGMPMFPQATPIVRAATEKLGPDHQHDGQHMGPAGMPPMPAPTPTWPTALIDALGTPSGPTEKTPAIERQVARPAAPQNNQRAEPVPVAAQNGRERDSAVVSSFLRRLWR